MGDGLKWTTLLGTHAGFFTLAGLISSDYFLKQPMEGFIAISSHQITHKQFEVIFSLDDGLIDHVQLLIMDADSPQHFRELLIGYQFFRLAPHQQQLTHKLPIPL